MTDPVDTGALRKLAAERNENNYNADNGWLLGSSGDALNTAADEVDRLRDELVKAIRDSRAATKTAQYERGRAEGYEREMDALIAVVENAPHSYECFADFAQGSKCTCWKADAL